MITVWKTPVVTTVEQVVADLKLEVYATGLLRDVNNTGSDLMCTCPFHGNGREHNPSLGVLLHEKVLGGKKHEAGVQGTDWQRCRQLYSLVMLRNSFDHTSSLLR